MSRRWAIAVVLAVSGHAWAQDGHGQDVPWVEQLVGGKLIDWHVEGDSVADKASGRFSFRCSAFRPGVLE